MVLSLVGQRRFSQVQILNGVQAHLGCFLSLDVLKLFGYERSKFM